MKELLEWLASYNRMTCTLKFPPLRHAALLEYAGKHGYVINRGSGQHPRLYITRAGREVVARQYQKRA